VTQPNRPPENSVRFTDDPAGNVGQAIDQILGQGKFMSLTGRQGEGSPGWRRR